MSDRNKSLHGNLEVPVTESLRAEFKKITQRFKDAVPRVVQIELLELCKTPEAKLELLDHLINVGMPVPGIHPDIRLSSFNSQQLARRAHYVRSRQRNEVSTSDAQMAVAR